MNLVNRGWDNQPKTLMPKQGTQIAALQAPMCARVFAAASNYGHQRRLHGNREAVRGLNPEEGGLKTRRPVKRCFGKVGDQILELIRK